MLILLSFAFIGGIVTVLSPCILPVLPIVLSGTVGSGKRKPLGIITGFIVSFTFFTLFLTSIVKATGISSDVLRNLAVVVLLLFGITLLIPQLQAKIEQWFSRLANLAPQRKNSGGFGGGFVIGISLGLIWTPCVGPILASVISLALTGSVTGSAFFITLAYSLGTAIPMLAIMYGGRKLLNKVPGLVKNLAKIQLVFGMLMILTALAIYFNIDRNFQSYVLEKFPNYGSSLTNLEDNKLIKQELDSFMDVTEKKENKKNNSLDLNYMDKYKAPELIPGGEWLNSNPLTLAELKGEVVLVDFMTYSCINCIRTFPALNELYEKYKDDGLVIIGLHTPEFEFEKDPKNVQKALNDFGIKFPVMQDNDFATWRVYQNRYWPHKFLIDHEGYVVYDHIGEGGYEETEEVVRKLLEARNTSIGQGDLEDDMSDFSNIETTEARSPEVYFGAWRNEYLGNGTQFEEGVFNFSEPDEIKPNILYLVGEWEVTRESAKNLSQDAKIIFKYNASKVFMVAGANQDTNLELREQDSNLIKNIIIKEQTLYRLIEKDKRQEEILQIIIKDPGLEVFTFTFG